MSKEDVMEITKCYVQGRTGKWASGFGAYQRKAEKEFYPYSAGRYRNDGDVAIRLDQGTYYLER